MRELSARGILTPALSRSEGERENGSLAYATTWVGDCRKIIGKPE
jgi:hypothetical protein